MTSRLAALCFAALDPEAVARFWSGLLGWVVSASGDGVTLSSTDDAGFVLRFVPTDQPKTTQNLVHFDLTSASWEQQQETVDRALSLGGRHVDVGQLPEEAHVVLGDPEGNELCVLEPGNSFLVDCGFVGALACDGSQAVGYFWSAALDWPLVWDQDEETAIRSPHGGPKVTWGGPPLMPKPSPRHVWFELVADDVPAEVERLVFLGATVLSDGLLADPDGNEFTLTTPG